MASAPMPAVKESSPYSSCASRYSSSVSIWFGVKRRQARLDDDVLFEIEHALHIFQRHIEHQRDAARERFQEPDMGDRRSQLDVPHTVTAHLRKRDFNAALSRR